MRSLHVPGFTSPEQLAEQLNHPTPEAVRNRALEVFGDEVKAKSWMNSASVVIPQEFNVLLNPAHRQYASLVWSGPKPFRFDSRLFTFESAD